MKALYMTIDKYYFPDPTCYATASKKVWKKVLLYIKKHVLYKLKKVVLYSGGSFTVWWRLATLWRRLGLYGKFGRLVSVWLRLMAEWVSHPRVYRPSWKRKSNILALKYELISIIPEKFTGNIAHTYNAQQHSSFFWFSAVARGASWKDSHWYLSI